MVVILIGFILHVIIANLNMGIDISGNSILTLQICTFIGVLLDSYMFWEFKKTAKIFYLLATLLFAIYVVASFEILPVPKSYFVIWTHSYATAAFSFFLFLRFKIKNYLTDSLEK